MRQRFQGGSAAFLGRSHISPPSLHPFILHRGHSWSYSSIRMIRTNSLTGEQQAQGSGALGVLAGRCPLGLSLLHARSQHCHASPAASASRSQTSSLLSPLPLAPALPGGFPGDPSKAGAALGRPLGFKARGEHESP